MRYFLIVGEASADLHASALIRALKARDAEASFAFMGGDKMQEASGVRPIVHFSSVAFMGFVNVVKNLRTITRIGKQVQEAILAFKPDVVIPVDFADFNLRFILPFTKKNLPETKVIYYILPKLWAWRSSRIKKLRRWVDHGLCILPFEEAYFRSHSLPVTYVGNPCTDAHLSYLASHPEEVHRDRLIVLVPGSRKAELKNNLPTMLSVAKEFHIKGWQSIIAGAPGLTNEDYTPYRTGYEEIPLTFGDTYGLMRRASLALVTSGTATLETALWHTPMVVCYRMGGSSLVRWLFKHFFSVRFFSLVNLILDREAVPELLGDQMNDEKLRTHITQLLDEDSSERTNQLNAFAQIDELMGQEEAADRAALRLLSLIR